MTVVPAFSQGPFSRSTRGRTVLLVSACALAAFGLRLVTYRAVLGGETVAFVESDAWYHMRLVDAMVRHFPYRVWYDPYLSHPNGEITNVGPFFDWLVAGAALVLGLGAPDERLISVVGAFVPAVLGALTVVPVYVLGRELFSRRAGLWAAAIVGVLPGDILERSLLGFTDHHCAEVLFSSLTLMSLVLALDPSRTRRRRITASLVAGAFLACYLLTWSGGALLVAVIVTWTIFEMIRRRPQDGADADARWTSALPLLIAGLAILPWARVASTFTYQIAGIGGGLLGIVILAWLARATKDLRRGRLVYVVTLLAGGVTMLMLAGWLVQRSGLDLAWHVQRFSPARTLTLAREAQPLMSSPDALPVPLWHQFTGSLALAVLGLAGAWQASARRVPARGSLFVIWTVTMVLATVGQVRFAYYLAVNVALCAGYTCDAWLGWLTRRIERRHRTDDLLEGKVAARTARGRVGTSLAGVALAVWIVAPSVPAYVEFAGTPQVPNDAWVAALGWLRDHTPDPFGDPGRYYEPLPASEALAGAGGMGSRYGVLSWWDYGYWIIRLAGRVPIANPRQTGAREAARFFLSQDEPTAAAIADSIGARYIIVNAELLPRFAPDNTLMTGFVRDMAGAIGEPPERYFRVAYRSTSRGTEVQLLYTAAYYQSMLSRLYTDGLTTSSNRTATWVVRLADRESGGVKYSELVSETPYADYATAQAFVAAARSPDVLIVGKDPFTSAVPLAALRAFVRVYRSPDRDLYLGLRGPSGIQIFEKTAR